jgi:molybdopterin-guanine dinucleotide biosynthesis protein A
MESSSKDVTAVILAGGLSIRFGSDKGLATWRGRRLVDHVLERLPHDRADTILVLRREQDEGSWPGVTIVHDNLELGDGPLRGVVGGLAVCHTRWAWVVACDQPLVRADLLSGLLEAASPDDRALIPEWGGRLQPLTGLYAVASSPLLAECASAGSLSLITALERIGYRVFAEEECRRYDRPGAGFLNINRPEHLAQLEGLES